MERMGQSPHSVSHASDFGVGCATGNARRNGRMAKRRGAIVAKVHPDAGERPGVLRVTVRWLCGARMRLFGHNLRGEPLLPSKDNVDKNRIGLKGGGPELTKVLQKRLTSPVGFARVARFHGNAPCRATQGIEDASIAGEWPRNDRFDPRQKDSSLPESPHRNR